MRAKLMLIGNGEAGKTSLGNSILGKAFTPTVSTRGIEEFICDVSDVQGDGKGEWTTYEKPEKELEAAVAALLLRRQSQEESRKDEDSVKPPSSPPLRKEEEEDEEGEDGEDKGKKIEQEKKSSVPSKILNYVSTVPQQLTSISSAKTSDVTEMDEELVLKFIDSMKLADNIVISMFDYGGQTVFNVIHHIFLTNNG